MSQKNYDCKIRWNGLSSSRYLRWALQSGLWTSFFSMSEHGKDRAGETKVEGPGREEGAWTSLVSFVDKVTYNNFHFETLGDGVSDTKFWERFLSLGRGWSLFLSGISQCGDFPMVFYLWRPGRTFPAHIFGYNFYLHMRRGLKKRLKTLLIQKSFERPRQSCMLLFERAPQVRHLNERTKE